MRSVRPAALEPALDVVRRLLGSSAGRVMVGIVGPPAAGKSTLATALAAELSTVDGASAVPVPMDGFHLANSELDRLGYAARKGAPETFDAAGFVHLLRRLRAVEPCPVYAPVYSRTLHESIGGVIAVPPDVRVVVVEGNYLLLDTPPWTQVPDLLDTVMYLDAPSDTRHHALVRRQLSRGLDQAAAQAWAGGSDAANARVIEPTKARADVVLARP